VTAGARAGRGPGYRRRARRLLALAAFLLAAALAAVFLLRGRARPYTAGAERDTSDEITRHLDRDLPADVPAIRFTEVATEAGIVFDHFQGRRSTQLPEDMGSGLAWGDYDGDGDPDLYLVNMAGPLPAGPGAPGGSPARSALYRNDGDGTFTDVTMAAAVGADGHGMGAAWGDADGDGDLDLFVTRYGANILYRNHGDGTFADATRETGLGGIDGFWSGASWADYDGDGDLDLYVCGYVRYRYDATLAGRASLQYQASVPYTLNPSTYEPERNLLYRNDGGRFREVGRAAGVDNLTGRSLSAAWADLDGDGRPDLYVANDVSDNALFHNRGDGTFKDISHAAWVADYRGAMGLGIGDWENDGDLDIFITHWLAQENGFYVNQKGTMPATADTPVRFLDEADQHGLGQIALDYIGWGAGFLDIDNDGRLDLYAIDGSTFEREDDTALLVPMRSLLFWNAGRERGYFEVGAVAGEAWTSEHVGRGAAAADYDGDGDPDLAVLVNGGRARLLRNDGRGGAWLRVVTRGPARGSSGGATPGAARPGGRPRRTPTFAEGAVLRLTSGGVTQMRVIGSGPSYLSQAPPGETHFGLGAATQVERLAIAWPDGRSEQFDSLPANAVVTLVEGEPPVVRPGGPRDRAAVMRFWRALQQATALRMKRDFGAAETAYREALAIDPAHEDCLYYLGQVLAELDRPDEARDQFLRLVAVNPHSARGHLALGALLSSPDARGAADLAAAEDHLRRAHDINGEETGPLVRLGEVLIVRGEVVEARRWLEDAARTNPKSIDAAFLAGYLRWEAGDRGAAAAALERARAAAQVQAPIKGVLGEGDRKAAPPLQSPLGKTLFGDLAAAATRAPAPAAADLDAIYAPVRARARDLGRDRGDGSLRPSAAGATIPPRRGEPPSPVAGDRR
jgi:tetratricopeptide (TPR) repeat protein